MIKKLTFTGGIHPVQNKFFTEGKAIEEMPVPSSLIIPFSQHTGKPAKPLVKIGDKVETGDKIGEADGFISANVHSPITGTVKAIEPCPHPIGKKVLSVIIEREEGVGQGFSLANSKPEGLPYETLSAKELVEIVREAGIVGLGGAAFPTSVKLSPPPDKHIDTVILNGSECEPYLTCDHRLMLEQSEEILKGGEIIVKILGADNAYIGIEDNKQDAIKIMEDIAPRYGFKVCVLRVKYPEGAEKQLIDAITKREVPSGGLPFDVGTYVQNVGTAIAIYEACKFGKPLIERVLTVTGDVQEPKNIRVKIGTPFKDVIDYCGGYKGTPSKIIMGGPMMGITQWTDNVPVVKATSGILILNSQFSILNSLEEPCIRCGMCVDVCPMNLVPSRMADFIENEKFEEAKALGVMDCMECGSCAYVCPAKRNLIHLFKHAKTIKT